MGQTSRVGKHKTTIERWENNKGHLTTRVKYHNTDVVQFDDDLIYLDTGGYFTYTTKLRMNQASNQFELDYQVYQQNWNWYVYYRGKIIPFNSNIVVLNRDLENE